MNHSYIRLLYMIMLLTAGTCSAFAQEHEMNGWLFWTHQQKITDRWLFSSDIQARSSDKFGYVNTLLIRPGIGYRITANQTLTLGYTYFGTWDKELGADRYEPENRIFEQYMIDGNLGRIELTNRFRYEQRFLKMRQEHFFAQRFRYYIQAQIPLITDALFTSGWYAAIQNELFLHVQDKNKLFTKAFNQNRTYAGTGYRFGEKLELEAGYVFRYITSENTNTRNNIFQLTIRTSF